MAFMDSKSFLKTLKRITKKQTYLFLIQYLLGELDVRITYFEAQSNNHVSFLFKFLILILLTFLYLWLTNDVLYCGQ